MPPNAVLFLNLVQYLRPSGSGRIGTLIYEDVQELLSKLSEDVRPATHVALSQLSEWSTQGKKVNQLCERFGPGCLFYLSGILTPDL